RAPGGTRDRGRHPAVPGALGGDGHAVPSSGPRGERPARRRRVAGIAGPAGARLPRQESDTIAVVTPSTTLARADVDALVAGGVRHVVLAPGSRSAPLAYEVQAADRA